MTMQDEGESKVSVFPPRVAFLKKEMAVSKVICWSGLGLFSIPIRLKGLYVPSKVM